MAHPGPDGAIVHAELAFGDGVVMLGTAREEHTWRSAVYAVVDDVDAHYERAKAAGAAIEYEPRDTDYGSREYGARDPEGVFWSFGTYVPSLTPDA